MDRAEKEALISELKDDFDGAAVVIVTRQSGMTVSEAIELRTKCARPKPLTVLPKTGLLKSQSKVRHLKV